MAWNFRNQRPFRSGSSFAFVFLPTIKRRWSEATDFETALGVGKPNR